MSQKPTDTNDKKAAQDPKQDKDSKNPKDPKEASKDPRDLRDQSDGKSLNKEKNPKPETNEQKDQREKREKDEAADMKDQKMHEDKDNKTNKKYDTVVRDDQGGNGHKADKTGLARDHPAHAKLPPGPPAQKDEKNPDASDEIGQKNLNPAPVTEEPNHPRNRIYKPHVPYNLSPLIDDADGYSRPPYASTKEGFNTAGGMYVNCHLCVNEEQHKKHKDNELYLDETDDQHKADFARTQPVKAK